MTVGASFPHAPDRPIGANLRSPGEASTLVRRSQRTWPGRGDLRTIWLQSLPTSRRDSPNANRNSPDKSGRALVGQCVVRFVAPCPGAGAGVPGRLVLIAVLGELAIPPSTRTRAPGRPMAQGSRNQRLNVSATHTRSPWPPSSRDRPHLGPILTDSSGHIRTTAEHEKPASHQGRRAISPLQAR